MNQKSDIIWKSININTDTEPDISKNALTVLERRYLAKDDSGKAIETPMELFKRVASFVAYAEHAYNKTDKEIEVIAQNFYDIMARLEFIPNSPTLMNAGRPLGQLSACFVLPVEDSMDKIFDTIKHMALIHKSGGGTGFSFSKLRPKNDTVQSTAGVSSGPVSFMSIFNAATETIKQGGTRRGANMAILSVDHPDILEFIRAKEDKTQLTNFNISVAITDTFMKAVKNDETYDLLNPRTKETYRTLKAKDVYNEIIKKAWLNGEPGIIFIDRINAENTLREIGLVESTNPCGEQPLLPYESCNLGSINLNKFVLYKNNENTIDFDKLKKTVKTAVRFLDNVIDINKYPLEAIKVNTQDNRKIGLGIMGFADLLIRLNIPYNSEDAVRVAEEIMSFIQKESTSASEELAIEKGAFPNFEKSEFKKEGHKPVRNATTTTIAPTGTISIIANSSSGIEPIFALAYVRNVMDNDRLVEINPLFESYARDNDFYSSELMEQVAEEGSVAHIDDIPENAKKVFVTAHDISPEWHIKLQAAFQGHVDNAVSKTVNFAHSATVEDIEEVYNSAYELGCKGVTVYRDGSRDAQVLELKSAAEKTQPVAEAPKKISPRPRNDITWGTTRKMNTGCGSLYVTINEDENGLFEIFATMGKSGGCAASQTEAVSRLISLGFRSGIDKDIIIKQIKGVRCPNQVWEKGGKIYSCADAIAKALERHESNQEGKPKGEPQMNFDFDAAKKKAETDGKGSDYAMVGVCPDCHGPLEFESGCSVCRGCGFSRCG